MMIGKLIQTPLKELQTEAFRIRKANFGNELTFSIPGDWKLGLGDAQNGQCALKIKAGPYPGNSGDVIPNIVVLVRQAKPGESLDDFIKNFLPAPSATPTREFGCPSQECLSFEIVKPGFYKGEGDAHALIRGLRRDAPRWDPRSREWREFPDRAGRRRTPPGRASHGRRG